MFAAATMSAASLCAQSAVGGNPLSTDLKQAYTSVKNNFLGAAEKMPEEDYGYKPTPDIRSFGSLVAHVADSQTRACNALRGEQKPATASSKTTKADIVAALKESFADCDSA